MNQHYFNEAEQKHLVDRTCAIAVTPDRGSVVRTIAGMSRSFAANTKRVAAEEAAPVNFERFAREWEAGAAERDHRREQIGQFFDEIRDRQKAAEWGCSVDELPWRMRARIAAGKAILV